MFLWHFPAGFPGWALPTALPSGVRTFLEGSPPPRRVDPPAGQRVSGNSGRCLASGVSVPPSPISTSRSGPIDQVVSHAPRVAGIRVAVDPSDRQPSSAPQDSHPAARPSPPQTGHPARPRDQVLPGAENGVLERRPARLEQPRRSLRRGRSARAVDRARRPQPSDPPEDADHPAEHLRLAGADRLVGLFSGCSRTGPSRGRSA